MTYPTMPRPTDNTGDNHRAAIAALEEHLTRNRTRRAEVEENLARAKKTVEQQTTVWEELRGEAESLQRGIEALKAVDQ